MPEDLAPDVYVEETSFQARSIEGVATSTCGFVGQARYGPTRGLPELITSFEGFKRVFGDTDDLVLDGLPTTNHLAYAVRLFFENGGTRLYVSRVYSPPVSVQAGVPADGQAQVVLLKGSGPGSDDRVCLRARFPGRAGNVQVVVRALRSRNLLSGANGARRLRGVRRGDVVEVVALGAPKEKVVSAGGTQAINPARLYAVSFDSAGQPVLTRGDGSTLKVATATVIQKITVDLEVRPGPDGSSGDRTESFQRLSVHPDSEDFIGRVLRHNDRDGEKPPADGSQRVYLARGAAASPMPTPPFPTGEGFTEAVKAAFARDLLKALTVDAKAPATAPRPPFTLSGGSDGRLATGSEYAGAGEGRHASGLKALAEIDDIAIVAAPGSAALSGSEPQAVIKALISHCETLRFRFAILAGPRDADLARIRGVRSQIDSTYAALYYPWLLVPPVAPNAPPLPLSPEGAVAGIYARCDIERGVHRAPANATVRGVLRFSRTLSKGEQDLLLPEGINCLRFFEGRGYQVWGARTISSDREWVYVNVRRLFIFIEHSIDRSIQWAVFEPNTEELWQKLRLMIESFLHDLWRNGELPGTRPQEAFFVRCDRSTMSQGDLDNGRLICVVGVAPIKPAEFIIFRIGLWTADASFS